jgi:hypothetical protein
VEGRCLAAATALPANLLSGRSLRVAFVTLVVIPGIVFAVILVILVILVVFFFSGLLSKEDLRISRAVRGIRVKEFWTCLAHAQWYAARRHIANFGRRNRSPSRTVFPVHTIKSYSQSDGFTSGPINFKSQPVALGQCLPHASISE